MNPDPSDYFATCPVIDHDHATIVALADEIAGNESDQSEIAKKCFEWVRDEIQHSSDYQRGPVTCAASEVLQHGTGYCYAKSHLLAALLRANEIPAGLCYQRLSIDGTGAPFCLHGLCGIYLQDFGWYRVDPRGNKSGVNAQFNPPREQLAFSTDMEGEFDLPEIFPSPLPNVVQLLRQHTDWDELLKHLPDAES